MATRSKTTSNGTNGARTNGARTNGNGRPANGSDAVATAEARRIATEIGSALLVASRLETARHSDDVELIAGAICQHLGLNGSEREDILAGARLHDIGKASIPRDLLDKPAALSPKEWELMRTHTVVGEEILGTLPELEEIARLVRHSHERWDGGGYPDGLAADEIPLGSRIIFCADAFHAIRSDRPYRKGVPAAQALGEIRRCSGTQFDPEVVAAFEQVIRDLRIVPGSKRRGSRSARLTALLLCLAVGGGGSAIAGSDLLGDPDAGEGAAPPVVLQCGSFYCYTLTPTIAVSAGGAASAAVANPLQQVLNPAGPQPGAPGAATPGGPVVGPGGSVETRPTGTAPGSGEQTADGGDEVGKDGSAGGDNPAGGGEDAASSGKAPKPDKDKNPNANGNGWAKGHDKNKVPEPNHGAGGGGGPEAKPPDLPDLPEAPSVGGPGNSANAPGHNKPPKPPKPPKL